MRVCSSTTPPTATALLPLLLLLLSWDDGAVVRAQYDDEDNHHVTQRIHERLAAYLDRPANVLLQVERYRANGAFPANLGASDRDAFFMLDESLMGTYPEFKSVYYGLEDGTFAGQGIKGRQGMYREPGHSGYEVAMVAAVNNSTMTTDGEGEEGSSQEEAAAAEEPPATMAKHYGTCIHPSSGETVPCRMKTGGKYTECTAAAPVASASSSSAPPLFDCALEKCADDNSQVDCESPLWNETERAECLANIKWCSSYVIKEAPANATLGYVPRSTYCVDHTGVPTESRGEVLKINGKFGSCYYSDGVTPVKRSIEGDFAYCGGNGKVCNDTFVGAFNSRDYDARWRPWYIDTKALQRPNWSPPYPFFIWQALGVTFSVPLYTMQDDGQNVFAGVLAVDYTFNGITDFLREIFEDSPIEVAVFERAEPHYMVASSTGGVTAKSVLVEDESKQCPISDELRHGSCKPIRVRAADFSESDISVAFSTMKDEGFPEMEFVATRSKDGNVLYATQLSSFSVEDVVGLDWTVMIMTPLETYEADQIVRGSSLFGALIALAGLGFVVCITLGGLLMQKRTEREVVFGDWRFTSAFVGGCALLNASCLSFLGGNTDALCLTRMWLVHFFFVFTLAFLFVKTYRMYKLVGSGMRRTTISHAQAARMTLPFIGLQTLILLIFTFVDPNKRTEIVATEGFNITHRSVCAHNTQAFFITMLIFEGGLIVVGCVLAFKTRHLKDDFNESKQIILAMYDTAVIGSVVLIVSKTSESYQGEQRILITLGIFWTTSFASLVFVLPRLMQVKSRLSGALRRISKHCLSPVQVTGLNMDMTKMQNEIGHGHDTPVMTIDNSGEKDSNGQAIVRKTMDVKGSEIGKTNRSGSDEESPHVKWPDGVQITKEEVAAYLLSASEEEKESLLFFLESLAP